MFLHLKWKDMSIITVNTNNNLQTIDLQDVAKLSHIDQLQLLNELDKLLVNVNKNKYENAKEAISYIKSVRSPQQINTFEITLLALMDFFQKQYVVSPFRVNLNKIPEHIRAKLDWQSINIISKINNFPHLVGISGARDDSGEIVSKSKPKEFLDGVLYQCVLLNSHEEYILDYEKLEVLPWMHQTLSNPTYILSSSAINTEGTKFHADLIFIRSIFNSDKYNFHIVGLKNESGTNFTFKSQFAIRQDRHNKIKKMFNLEKAIFDFFKEKKKVLR